jgi:RsiW-degrading membrane proteinase PrsW (M82 family)
VSSRTDLVRSERWSIIRPSEPAFWVFCAFVAYGVVRVADALSDLTVVATSGWALALFLVALYTLPAFVLVYELDLYEREPVPMVLGAFAWGAFAATGLSLDAAGWNEVFAAAVGTDAAARWSAVVVAPLIEEGLKASGLVLLALIARDEIDDLMDGFVYGALCGLGFTVVEDVFYFIGVFGGDVGGVLRGFFVRVIASGLYSHVLYTGLVGMAIAIVTTRREAWPRRARRRIAGLLAGAAVFGHFLWNSPTLEFFPAQPWEGTDWFIIPVATAVKGLPLLLFVVLAIRLAHARERRWLHETLVSEVGEDAVTPQELAILESPRLRLRARRELDRRAGPRAAELLKRLQREQVNLAMIRSRVASENDPALLRQRAVCRSLRDALEAIPGASSASGVAGRTWIDR